MFHFPETLLACREPIVAVLGFGFPNDHINARSGVIALLSRDLDARQLVQLKTP